MTNPAPSSIQLMLQLTDGTVLAQSYDGQTWMKLTPDAHGSYANGTWTTVAAGLVRRLYFASQILPDGRVWVLGGEYSGPGLQANWANSGEIYDPTRDTWTPIAPVPPDPNCPGLNYATGTLTGGSPIITNIYPYTTRLSVGWSVTAPGIPAGATITSIDSPTQITISAAATLSAPVSGLTFDHYYQLIACAGDVPSQLLPGNRILVGALTDTTTWIYNVALNAWTQTGAKVYSDLSDEEGWAKLPDGKVITYDIFKSLANSTDFSPGMFAEIYSPATGTWSGISPSDGTAAGSIPALSGNSLGDELGPVIRLQDGRVFFIGATEHTALYNPSSNRWTPGPDILGTLTNSVNAAGVTAPFGADDAPAAVIPSGHVIFAADAGPAQFTSSGNITRGSYVITHIPSTARLQLYWRVAGIGIPPNSIILSIDSPSQVTIDAAATDTINGDALTFGGVFSEPTQLFDFNPKTNSITALQAPIPDGNLPYLPAYQMRMLTLPTGEVMFSDSSTQPWIYTPDGPINPAMRPVVNRLAYNGGGMFTLTGRQLNGQSAGAAYGDDDQMDTNYPIIRFTATDGSGRVYYARTMNWSSVAVGGGINAVQTVNLTLNPAMDKPGLYAVTVCGAGISSIPVFVTVTTAEINRQ